MKNYLNVALIMIVLFCLSCSKNNPIEPSDDISYSEMLDNVVFVPDSGPPGTVMEISNLMLPVGEDSVWSLDIGGQVVPLLRDSSAVMHTIIPLIFEDSNAVWVTTPSTPVNVTLFRLDKPVDSLIDMITLDSLAHASGAADTLIADLMSGADAIQSIALSMGITDTVMLATYDALDEILYTGENSLSNILNGNSTLVPGDSMHKEIFSALLVSSGYADFFSAWSDSLRSAAVTIKSYKSRMSLSALTDEGLAARMQLQAFINDFGTIVVGNTALDWQTASGIIGTAGIVFPAISFFEFIVSYIVSELDFVINKIIVAAFPSKISNFDLDFMNHQINVGDTTEAIVYISAENNPPNITPMDIVLQVVGGMQLVDWIRSIGVPRNLIQRLGNIDQIIQDITVWWLSVINNILSANYNYPTQLDINFPQMTWDSVQVHNPELIDLIIPDLSKLDYINASFNGRAKDSLGTISLQMRTQPPGPNTWIHPVMTTLGYVGGPFGNDLYTSNVDTVTIVGELALQVDFANTITVGGANVLGLNAGYYDRNGNPYWVPNINITLTVANGTADVTSGVTDAQGHFNSMITLDSGADSVVVHVFAYGDNNSQSDTIVVAISDAIASDTLGSGWGIRCVTDQGNNGSWVQVGAGCSIQNSFVTRANDVYDDIASEKDCSVDFSANLGGSTTTVSTQWGSGNATAGASASMSPKAANPDYYKGFTASGTSSGSVNWSELDTVGSYNSISDFNAIGSAGTLVSLFVDSGYFIITFQGTLTVSGGDSVSSSGVSFTTTAYSDSCLGEYSIDTNVDPETSVAISDVALLSPGRLYVFRLETATYNQKHDGNVSGSGTGSASYSLICTIRRAPMQ